ncbi:unnamed protein product [Haemonchus placei]|uniref:Uncharacterized protein n=1 Tax=Haemonchus placei TaxID=6290 RepID=A0A3P7V707_HAEPC|nr:unnamed protein product [Haemonchus placei]
MCSVSCPSGADDASYLEIHMEVLKWDRIEVSPTSNQESPVSKAIHLVSLMRLFHSSLCTGSADLPCVEFDYLLVLESIRWRNEQNRKFARGIALLNSVCHDTKKFSSLLFDDAFSTVVLSFWKNVDFDPQLSSLSVSDLVHCELKKFVNQLWRLAANSTLLSRLITKVLKSANSWLEDLVNGANHPVDDWRIRLDVGVGIMQKALPPRNTLDPVIFEEQREAYQLSVFHVVDQPLSVLAKWRNSVSKQPPECDSRSPHPVIASLWKIRLELSKLLEGSQERPRVFRQKASLVLIR